MEKLSRSIAIIVLFVLAAGTVPNLFAQDATPPTLVSKSPEDFASGVDRLAPIVLTFDEPMRPQGEITVGAATGGIFPVLYSWSANGLTLTVTPASALPANTFIVWLLDTSTFADLAGNELEDTGEESGFYQTGSTATGGGGGGNSGTGTNAITNFQLAKLHFYEQSSAAGPVLDPDIGYSFNASTTLASNRTATNITLALPTSRTVTLTRNFVAQENFFFFDYTNNLAALDASYPLGNYVFTVRSASSNQTVTVNFPAGNQPNAPRISNYAAAQAVDPSQPFTLTWDAFQGGAASDAISVSVGSVFNSPSHDRSNALRGTATSITIPAGTLAPGSNYESTILFIRPITVTNAGYVTSVFRSTTTAFTLRTIGGGTATNEPIVFANPTSPAGGGFQFTLSAAVGRTVLIEYANQLTNWLPLLATNTILPSTTITDPNPADASRIYRARYLVP